MLIGVNVIEDALRFSKAIMEVVGEVTLLGAIIAEGTLYFLVSCTMEEGGTTAPAVNEVKSCALNLFLIALLGLTLVFACHALGEGL